MTKTNLNRKLSYPDIMLQGIPNIDSFKLKMSWDRDDCICAVCQDKAEDGMCARCDDFLLHREPLLPKSLRIPSKDIQWQECLLFRGVAGTELQIYFTLDDIGIDILYWPIIETAIEKFRIPVSLTRVQMRNCYGLMTKIDGSMIYSMEALRGILAGAAVVASEKGN